MAESSADEFFQELDNFELQMPGAQRVPFKDNESLVRMFRSQYPNWKEEGNVTSVPVARVPRLFLQNTQMSKKLQDSFKYLQKGETGETKVYRLFLHETDPNQEGMMVFPNVNPQEIFKSKSALVEIDMVVAHPTKGFLVLNIKNQGGKGLTPQKIQDDIERHGTFIRKLMQYGQDEPVDTFPIHSVICHLHDDDKEKFVELTKPDGDQTLSKSDLRKDKFAKQNQVLILSKSDLTKDDFAKQWKLNLEKLPDFDPYKKEFLQKVFEIALARLVTLSSLERSAALINEQLIFNCSMQTINKTKGQFCEKTFDAFDPLTKSQLETASKIKMTKTKTHSGKNQKPENSETEKNDVEKMTDDNKKCGSQEKETDKKGKNGDKTWQLGSFQDDAMQAKEAKCQKVEIESPKTAELTIEDKTGSKTSVVVLDDDKPETKAGQFKYLAEEVKNLNLKSDETYKKKFQKNEKSRFIIWTVEQLEIIAKVMRHLQNPTENGYLRLLVTGCKGSGKTMLMVFLARVAKILLEQPVCDSQFQNEVLAIIGVGIHFLIADILQQLLDEPHGVKFLHPEGGLSIKLFNILWYIFQLTQKARWQTFISIARKNTSNVSAA